MSEKLSSSIGLNTDDFKTGVAQLNRDLKLVKSEFAATASTFVDWAKDIDGLEARTKSLNSQIEIQGKKVAATRAEYERMVEVHGADSRAAQEMLIKVNNETAALGKLQTELTGTEKTLDSMKNSTDQAGKSTDVQATATGGLTKQLGLLKVTIPGLSAETSVLEFTLGGVVIEMDLLEVAAVVVEAALVILAAAVAAVVLVLAAMATGAIVAAKGITDLVVSSADAADKLAELSSQTGISTTKLQELDYTGKAIGTSLETITGAQAKLIRSMSAAATQTDKFGESQDKANAKVASAQQAYADAVASYGEGSNQAESAAKKLNDAQAAIADVSAGPVQQAFDQLGVKVRDANGHLRDSEVVFGETLDALKKIQDPTERDAVSMQIFGKSAQELNPVINAGKDGLKKYADEAHKMGAVVDTETVDKLSGFKDQMDSIDGGLKGVGATVAGVFLPYFTGIASAAQTQLAGLAAAVNGSVGLRQTTMSVSNWLLSASSDFAKTAPNAVENMAKTLNQNLPFLIKSAVTAVSTIAGTLLKMAPTFLSVGFTAIKSLGQGVQSNLPGLLKTATTVIPQLISQLATNLPILIQMGADILTTLANGLTASLPKIMPEIAKLIALISTTIVDNLPTLILVGIQLITAFVQGFAASAPILIPLGPKLIKALLDGLMANKTVLVKAAGDLIGQFLIGLANQIPYIIQGAAILLLAFANAIVQGTLGLPDVGAALVQGIWQGIQTGWAQMLADFQTLIAALPDAIKKLLGFSGTTGAGIQTAGLNELGRAKQQMSQALHGFSNAPAFAGAGAGRGNAGNVSQSSTDNSIMLQGNINFYGPQTPGTLGAVARQKARRY